MAAEGSTRKVGTMDNAHAQDWSVLDLGHPAVSQQTVYLVDLRVDVWGVDEIADSTRPVTCIILAHGWANKAKDMEPMAAGLLGEFRRLDAEHGGRKRDVIVATLDQRNHGERRVNKTLKPFAKNPRQFGIDMATALVGGKQDVELVMQFLSGRLWADGSREISEWVSVGFSMGGHLTWRLLRESPQIRLGVPICSTPSESLGNLLRAEQLPPGAPEVTQPPEVVHYFSMSHHEPRHWERYAGKKILAIHGQLDNVMPFRLGAENWAKLTQHTAVSERYEEAGRGHVCSPPMVKRAAQFIWDHSVALQQ